MSDKSRIETVYQLSPLQEGMLFHTAADAGSGVGFEQATYTLTGHVDVQRFRNAWQHVIDRHAILRTAFNKAGTMQVVFKKASVPWTYVDLSELSDDERAAELAHYVEQDRCNGFDVTTAPLLRFALIRFAGTIYKFVVSYHHALLDGWSYVQVLREVITFYEALGGHVELQLPEPRPFRDYIKWLKRQDETKAEAFWRERLDGFTEPTYLVDGFRLGSSMGEAGEVECVIDSETTGLQQLTRRYQVTLNTIVQGAWGLLLSKYTGKPDVVFGATVSGRPAELGGVETMVGLFINTLPVRVRIEGEKALYEWLRGVQRQQAESYEYQYARLSDIQGWSEIGSGRALFDTLVVFENYPSTQAEQAVGGSEGFRVSGEESWERVNYPLALVASGTSRVRLRLSYHQASISAGLAARLLRQLEQLLSSMAGAPEAKVSSHRLLGEAEQRLLLENGRGVKADYGAGQRIEELVSEQARRQPAAIAVADEEEECSYAELERRAAGLAQRLRQAGVGAEGIVGVLLPRSVAAVWAMLGVWKAGGAYVPLDVSYPAARVRELVQDSGMKWVISRREIAVAQEVAECCVPVWLEEVGECDEELGGPGGSVDGLAYVIYTSGSTGQPKGVGVTQRSLHNLVRWHNTAYGVQASDRMTQVAALSFDASVWELWPALAGGARVEVVPAAVRGDWVELGKWLERKGITITFMPTPVAEQLLNGGVVFPSTLGVMLTGGDRLRRWADPNGTYKLVNHYGPTENTVLVSSGLVATAGEGLPPIGKAIPNTQLYVLDGEGELSPQGVSGELYIGGAGVARGYLNRPALTAERFVPDPFSTLPGSRLYRTGDLVRWREDGELEFLGRADQQVKLRGYRIELGEVEAVLSQHAGVQQCVVVVRELGGSAVLIGYVVGTTEVAELREYLVKQLPAYMVPQRLVKLASLPLTSNGKLDRKALPEPEQWEEKTEPAGPRTPTEELLCGIWAEVLGREQVGREENFFELGGHSLLATQVVSRVRAVFGVEVALRVLFERGTVAVLAAEVELQQAAGGAVAPALERAERRGALPLSFAQQRLWFMEQLEPGNAAYNVPLAVRLRGALDYEALRAGLSEIVRRHEVLRTRFVSEGGAAVQVIEAARAVLVPVLDVAELGEGGGAAAAQGIARAEAKRAFELSQGGLLRTVLVRLGAQEHVLVVVLHHIVSDAWSSGVLVQEFRLLYEAYRQQQASPLAELRLQYGDYAVWQRGWMQGEVLEQELQYWRRQLAGLERLELGGDSAVSSGGEVVSFELSAELRAGLRELGRREGVTLFMILTAALQLLLSRYTGQTDVAIGTDIANRNRVEIEPLVGFFINQLVLRARLDQCQTVRELLAQVRETVLGAYGHQELPFERLVEELSPERGSGTPLFTAKLVLQNAPQAEVAVGGLVIESFGELEASAKLDLHLAVDEQEGGGLACVLTYPGGRYERERMERLGRHYGRVLEFFSERETGAALGGLRLAAREEQAVVEALGRGPAAAVAGTVLEWIEAQAEQQPEQCALLSGEGAEAKEYSYGELSRRSNQLGHYLQQLGVGAETRVAVYLERSAEFVLAVLGIWKAGAAYVPLDPEQPGERVAVQLEDSGAAVVVTSAAVRGGLPSHWAVEVSLDEQAEAIASMSEEALETKVSGAALAYVMYTSGSTGEPKGVAIEQRQLANYVQGVSARLGLERGLSYGLVSTVAADLGHTVLYPSLATGGTLHLIAAEVARDGAEMARYLRAQQLDCVKVTPSHLQAWLRSGAVPGWPRRRLVLGGERLAREWVREVRAAGGECELWNHYGPTETTVGVTAGRAENGTGATVGLGQALANTQLYVLDGEGELSPQGVSGELYIGGAGVARGYLNRPALTAERFVPDPFSALPGSRLYRTGDLVRWREDGELEFLGRADQQVKLRGYRIELGEVEAVLSQHAGVQQCVVVVRELGGSAALIGYVVGTTEVAELREYLVKQLPAYMVPQRLVKLASLPLTSNGKLDRKALPEPEQWEEKTEPAGPRTPTEELLCGIWAEVLGREQVGREENFFELGGHSLLATQVVSRVRAVFGVEVALRVLFERGTVAALAAEVELQQAAGGAVAPALERAERRGALPLSFAQQRLWFMEQLEPGNAAYNVPRVVRLTGALDCEALRAALSEIVRRHEVLRTSFPTVAGEPVQEIAAAAPLPVPLLNLSRLPAASRAAVAQQLAAVEASRPFALARGPVVRALLLRLDQQEHVLVVVLHHIVSDGWSVGVLIKEFNLLYAAYQQQQASPLAELPLQYADYAVWQRGWLQGEVLEKELQYWRTQLHGLERLELPTDKPRSAKTGRGAVVSFEIELELTERLRQLSRREGVTLFMLLVAGLQLVLSRYAGQSNVAIGTAIANRNRVEIEPLVGFFINQLVLRARLEQWMTVRDFLAQVRETVLSAYAHQELPFERVVEEITTERDPSRFPLFDHEIVFQSLNDNKPLQVGDTELDSMSLDFATPKLDLDFLIFERESITGYVYYNADLFTAATVEHLVQGLQSTLDQFTHNVEAELNSIPTLHNSSEFYEAQLSTSLELLAV